MKAISGKRGLGRGLSSLIGDSEILSGVADESSGVRRASDQRLPIELLRPNSNQPRHEFSPESIRELADSVQRNGIIQPIIVRPDPQQDGGFEIVAGERRWRAAQLAQLHEVPVIVRELSEIESMEIAIVENIQRADLNPIEESEAYRKLIDRFGHTQEELAEVLGKSRSYIANLLRLLSLPYEVQKFVREGLLSAGHARALVPVEDPTKLANEIVKKGLSVRQTEDLAKRTASKEKKTGRPVQGQDASTRELAANLSANLDSRVKFKLARNGKTGQIMIDFRSLDHLDEICDALMEAGKRLRDRSGLGLE